jgi:hypothetical protein
LKAFDGLHSIASFPQSLPHKTVKEAKPAAQSQQKSEGLRCDFLGAIIRHIRDMDPPLTSRNQVNIVQANSVAADDLASRELLDRLASDRDPMDNYAIGIPRQGYDFVVAPAFPHYNVGIQRREYGPLDLHVSDGVNDNDFEIRGHRLLIERQL